MSIPGRPSRPTKSDRFEQFDAHPDNPPQEITGGKLHIHLMSYGPDGLQEEVISDIEQIPLWQQRPGILWVNVTGLNDVASINRLGEIFELHPLAVEDIVNLNQRPKVEDYGHIKFVVAKSVTLKQRLDAAQLSIFLSSKWLLTFVEAADDDCLQPVRDRITRGRGQVRKSGTDYLLYLILDAVIDGYFPVVEAYGDRLDSLEDEIIEKPSRKAIGVMHGLKRDLLELRRAIWPMRDVTNILARDDSDLISQETQIYLRDCYDHTVRLIDLVETDRDLVSDLLDVYLSSVSNRLNEVMKVLTIITTIFIPPTFIAGIYGMNFSEAASPWNMPELHWRYGYLFALALMLISMVVTLLFLRFRGWLGGDTDASH